jgi:FkbM family methyltransferase
LANFAEFVYTVLLRPKPLKNAANQLIKRLLPAELNLGGAVVVLNPNDPVVSGALTFGVYEKPETAFFCAACKPGMTFLDIGANVGYYTALAVARIGSGKIIAIEPDPENFDYLQKTVAANHAPNVICIPQAVAAEKCVLVLYRSTSNRGDNRLYPNNLCDSSIEVPVSTVDQLMRQYDVGAVNLVKIDVQGFEGHVIQGMQYTILGSPDLTLLMEFWPFGLRSAGTDPEGLLVELERMGFRLYELTPKGSLAALTSKQALILRYPGRRYTNIAGFRGNAEPPLLVR